MLNGCKIISEDYVFMALAVAFRRTSPIAIGLILLLHLGKGISLDADISGTTVQGT